MINLLLFLIVAHRDLAHSDPEFRYDIQRLSVILFLLDLTKLNSILISM
jgi:hypothetical protein